MFVFFKIVGEFVRETSDKLLGCSLYLVGSHISQTIAFLRVGTWLLISSNGP